ncbi:hypothetical protein F4803DRAFT_545129 [Xylaria telfairii]|nr:hypothetical protein F4803DRAFT_545129 [Xylaria telfairii]
MEAANGIPSRLSSASRNGDVWNRIDNRGYQSFSSPGNGHPAQGAERLAYEQSCSPAQIPTPLESGASSMIPSVIVSSPPRQCFSCPDNPRFRNTLDYNRHMKYTRAHWDSASEVYECACGYNSSRRDNYIRHLRKHTVDEPVNKHYTCRCGEKSSDLNGHSTHVYSCRHRRRSSGRSPVP